MKNEKQKCSTKEHENIDANSFCNNCKIYICNKCEVIHSKLFNNHNCYNLNENINNLFIDLCTEKNHFNKLKYFCKTHNVLCCGLCITKIKDNENGQHKDCEICPAEEILEEKMNNLKDNIKILENISLNIDKSIKKIKIFAEKQNENKENLKKKIQILFTKLRNCINEREEEIMEKIDEAFNNLFIKEEFLKESDKMPEKIKLYIKKGKEIEYKSIYNENTNSLIYDCLNIENSIKSIKYINEHIIENNIDKNKIPKFIIEENKFNYLLEKIKTSGRIFYPFFKFRKCPENIEYNRKYNIIGEDCNIITRNNSSKNKEKRKIRYIGIICENELEKEKIYIWRIKVLFSYDKEEIIVGIAPSKFDINSSMYDDGNCGWYFTWNGKEIYIQENKENFKMKKKDSESDEDSSSEEEKKPKKKKKMKKKNVSDSDEDSSSEEVKKLKKKKKKRDSSSDDKIDSCSEKEEKKEISSENENLCDIEEEDEIILEMNMKEKKLKLIKKNKTINEISNIEVDEGIYPVVFLGNENDSVKIENVFLK